MLQAALLPGVLAAEISIADLGGRMTVIIRSIKDGQNGMRFQVCLMV